MNTTVIIGAAALLAAAPRLLEHADAVAQVAILGRKSFAVTTAAARARSAAASASARSATPRRRRRTPSGRADQTAIRTRMGASQRAALRFTSLSQSRRPASPSSDSRHRVGRRLRCAVRPAHRPACARAAGPLRDRAAPHHRRRGEGARAVGDHPVGRPEERARRRRAVARRRHLRPRHPGARASATAPS